MSNNSKKLPKIIKRKRNKKYTEKRDPYNTYLSAKWKLFDVFKEIDEIKNIKRDYLKETTKNIE